MTNFEDFIEFIRDELPDLCSVEDITETKIIGRQSLYRYMRKTKELKSKRKGNIYLIEKNDFLNFLTDFYHGERIWEI